ncbi:hypothetical protein OIU84_016615 [Salix udensis]|uniref:Uncharacterized protein n=1 Tax=Salix udensis TaxID=889485 RepID=A0AAD6J9U5_9ROSI|nr:hypothetical protein OIU84_016615 [Salix udensis]
MSRGSSLSRATKNSFHREKDEHTGDGDRACLVSSGQHEQDVQNEFSKGSEHCPFSRTIVAKKLPCR